MLSSLTNLITRTGLQLEDKVMNGFWVYKILRYMKMVFFIFARYLTIFLKASAMYMPKNLGGKKTEQKLFNGIKIAFERQLKSQITQLQ